MFITNEITILIDQTILETLYIAFFFLKNYPISFFTNMILKNIHHLNKVFISFS